MNPLNKTSEVLMAEMDAENLIRQELNDVILYFDYQESEYETELSLITISKSHGERFLFHKTKSVCKLSCLNMMIEYIKSDYKTNFQTYEIIWCKKGESQSIKSWFNGKSFLDIIDKFFHLKDPATIIIYEVTLKPLS